MTHLFGLRRYCFFSQGAAIWAWALSVQNRWLLITVLREPVLWDTEMDWERVEISLNLCPPFRLCLFRLVFTRDWRAIGLQDHQFVQNFGAPSLCVGLLDALLSHPPRKATIFAWPGAFAICLLAGMQASEGRHHIVLFCFIQYLAKRKEKGVLALYQVSKVLK